MKKEAKEQLCEVSCASDMLVALPLFKSHSDFSFDICPVNALPTFGDLSKVPYLILTFLFYDGPSPSSTKEGQVFGMTWRFLPACDPLVSVTMSRDLDSRLTARFFPIMIYTTRCS